MNIERLMRECVEQTDRETLENLSNGERGDLLLLGSPSSPFLQAIQRKADKLGISTRLEEDKQETFAGVSGVVIDRETYGYNEQYIPGRYDIDNLFHDGLSCVAEAIYSLLTKADLVAHTHIVLLGRGHAVKGLRDALERDGATVTVCHSGTTPTTLKRVTDGASVLVVATPQSARFYPSTNILDLVLDLTSDPRGGSSLGYGYREMVGCDLFSHIGPLTISILLNRFSKA